VPSCVAFFGIFLIYAELEREKGLLAHTQIRDSPRSATQNCVRLPPSKCLGCSLLIQATGKRRARSPDAQKKAGARDARNQEKVKRLPLQAAVVMKKYPQNPREGPLVSVVAYVPAIANNRFQAIDAFAQQDTLLHSIVQL
jgi:hypothetical protein